jgi:hypothetical protein
LQCKIFTKPVITQSCLLSHAKSPTVVNEQRNLELHAEVIVFKLAYPLSFSFSPPFGVLLILTPTSSFFLFLPFLNQ